MALKRVLNEDKWLPNVLDLQNNVSPAQNKTNDHKTEPLSKGIKEEFLLPQKLQQYIRSISAKNTSNGCKL
jgi:hypothetical protein